MESFTEVTAKDYMGAMERFLCGEMNVDQFRNEVFRLNPMRRAVTEQVSSVLDRVFSYTDDYDPALRLSFTITEPELREVIGRLLEELKSFST